MKEKKLEKYNLSKTSFSMRNSGQQLLVMNLNKVRSCYLVKNVDNNLHSNTIVTISTEDGGISLLKSSTVRSHTNAPTHVSK